MELETISNEERSYEKKLKASLRRSNYFDDEIK